MAEWGYSPVGGGGEDGPGEWLDGVGRERVLCVCASVKALVKDG